MIKKLIGMLFALATLGVIGFAIRGHERYSSMIWPDGLLHAIREARAAAAAASESMPFPVSQPAAWETPQSTEEPARQSSGDEVDYLEDAEELPEDLFSDSFDE